MEEDTNPVMMQHSDALALPCIIMGWRENHGVGQPLPIVQPLQAAVN